MIRTVHPIGVLVPEPAPPWLPPSGVRQRISGPRREAPGDAGPEPGGSGRSPPRALSVVLNPPPRAGAGPALQGNVRAGSCQRAAGGSVGEKWPSGSHCTVSSGVREPAEWKVLGGCLLGP